MTEEQEAGKNFIRYQQVAENMARCDLNNTFAQECNSTDVMKVKLDKYRSILRKVVKLIQGSELEQPICKILGELYK